MNIPVNGIWHVPFKLMTRNVNTDMVTLPCTMTMEISHNSQVKQGQLTMCMNYCVQNIWDETYIQIKALKTGHIIAAMK